MKDIIVDVDMVVADIFTACQNVMAPHGVVLKAEQWGWLGDIPRADRAILDKHILKANFWADLPLIPHAKAGIQYLRSQGHNLIWATAPYHKVFGWESARKQFLYTHFDVKLDDIIFADKKWYIAADVIIDDKYTTVSRWQTKWPNGQALLFDAPYNSGQDTVDWATIIKRGMFDATK